MEKIILHACCAPCASYPIKKLIEDNFEPVVFFYNPNIFPLKEYQIRRDELKEYCKKEQIEFFEEAYEIKAFYEASKGLEKEREKGKRCEKCFYLRLKKTAEFAKKNNIKFFATSLTVSPHKDFNQIKTQGDIVASEFGLEFKDYNFKKQDGFKKSRQIAKENNMYFQTYCGCEFSIQENPA